ncbi:MAG: RNA-binding protein [Gammaproteobacteria bacterium]|jgi:RNA recognition motif-containing protein|nr:RNA-binding protein [Pseudomonadota bacterium]GIS33133.1 MAG: RNA-binding protein [Gammaproteobacteria bacterium]|tara:strand:+ start:248 stop:493 length:246 start_codon:yes stop_codon:yes gene_type:complete
MNLYVGNLPWSTSEEELEAYFAEHGEIVDVRIITEGRSGRSKGFGFVEMASDEAGKAAIEALNGKEFGGRELRVDTATDRN